MCSSSASQEEDTEQGKGQIPWVDGVHDGGDCRDEDARSGQRVLGPGPVDERGDRGGGDDKLHDEFGSSARVI